MPLQESASVRQLLGKYEEVVICAYISANYRHVTGYLTSSTSNSLSSQPSRTGSSFASTEGGRNVSGFKIMTVTRGFTEEADKLLDYLVRPLCSLQEGTTYVVFQGEWHFRRATEAILTKLRVRNLPCA